MKLNDQKLDELFRDRLKNLDVPPPVSTWGDIRQKLEGQAKNRRAVITRAVAIAAVLVLAFIAGRFYFIKPQLPTNQVSKIKQTNRQANPVEPVNPSVQPFDEKTLIAAQQSQAYSKSQTVDLANISCEEKSLVNQVIAFGSDPKSDIEMKRISGRRISFPERTEKLILAEKSKAGSITLSPGDKELLALNSISKASDKTRAKSWDVGFRVSPGYSSQSASHSDVYRQNMAYSNTSGSTDLNGGISVSYKTGKRLKVESGVYYSQNGQSSGDLSSLFAKKTDEYTYGGITDNFYSPVSMVQGKITMNSSAGVIRFSKTPAQVAIMANLDSENNYSNTIVAPGEFYQVFDFIEVPLLVRYNLFDQKFGIDLLGGLSANWLVGNNAYLGSGSSREYIGTTEGISTLSYSTTIGVGVGYKLGKRVSISMEPRFNYYINSINKSSDVDYHPYRIGVYTGLNYRF